MDELLNRIKLLELENKTALDERTDFINNLLKLGIETDITVGPWETARAIIEKLNSENKRLTKCLYLGFEDIRRIAAESKRNFGKLQMALEKTKELEKNGN